MSGRRKCAAPKCAVFATMLVSAAASHAEMPSISDIVSSHRIDGLSLAPDGSRLAYRVIMPSLETNRVDVQWRERTLVKDGQPVDVGPAVTPIMKPLFSFPLDGASQWAPDGRSLLVLVPDDRGVQIHRLGVDRVDERITDDPADVVEFSLDRSKNQIEYQVRNTRASISAKLAAESLQGIHIDRAVITDGLRLTDNFVIGGRRTTIRRLDLYDQSGEPYAGALRSVRRPLAGTHLEDPSSPTPAPAAGVLNVNRSTSTDTLILPTGVTIRMWAGTSSDIGPQWDRHTVIATAADGRNLTCSKPVCQHEDESLRELTFNPHTGEIVMFVGAWSAPTRIIAWDPATGRVRSLYDRQTFLNGGTIVSGDGCPRIDHFMICVEAGATSPERLIRLDLDNGSVLVLDDPNARLRAKTFPSVRAIHWLDPDGHRSNAILVMPTNGQTQHLPLVITTYRCEAFLRGGGAWLAPEFILAQHGMAALCTNSPDTHWDDKDAAGKPVPLSAHKFYLATLKLIIDQLAREQVIDPARVGITGHSFSSIMVAYAISHTDFFQAAVLGGAFGIDPSGYTLTAGTADSLRKNVYRKLGVPSPNDDPDHVWDAISPAKSAAKTSAALLMQLPESEYAASMEYYSAMQDARIPSDAYVYPREGHMIQAEPWHQYWRNLRTVEWFEFWLLGREDRTADNGAQFDHWEELRREDRRGVPTH